MYLALLRGINVGGHCKLPMKELAALFEAAGASAVRTYIQSGNVLFDARTPEAAAGVSAHVTAAITSQYGYTGRIVLRSTVEFATAMAANPFLAGPAPAEESALHLYFLATEPAPALAAALDPNTFAPDLFAIRGREIFLHLPNGMARTKLTNAWFDARLKTTSTARNWRTATTLLTMMQGAGPQSDASKP